MRTDARLQRCCISSVLFDKILDRTLIHALALQTEEKGIFVTGKRIDVLPLHQVGLKRVCYFLWEIKHDLIAALSRNQKSVL